MKQLFYSTTKYSGYVSPGKPFVLDNSIDTRQSNAIVIEAVNFKKLALWLNRPVYPFILLQDSKEIGGFVREWKPALHMTPARHMSYAYQWFGLAFALVVIFISVNIRKRQ